MCACAFPLLGIFDSVVTAAQTELENGRQRRVSASPSFFIIVSLWVDQKGNPKEFWMLKKKKKSGGGLWWLGSGRNLRATTEMTCFSISSSRIIVFVFYPWRRRRENLNVYQSISQLFRGLDCILVKVLLSPENTQNHVLEPGSPLILRKASFSYAIDLLSIPIMICTNVKNDLSLSYVNSI